MKTNINIFNPTLTAAVDPNIYIYSEFNIWDRAASEFKASYTETIGNDHELVKTQIPNATNPIGYVVNIPSDLPTGLYDLVYCDGTTYIGSLQFKKTPDQIIVIPE